MDDVVYPELRPERVAEVMEKVRQRAVDAKDRVSRLMEEKRRGRRRREKGGEKNAGKRRAVVSNGRVNNCVA